MKTCIPISLGPPQAEPEDLRFLVEIDHRKSSIGVHFATDPSRSARTSTSVWFDPDRAEELARASADDRVDDHAEGERGRAMIAPLPVVELLPSAGKQLPRRLTQAQIRKATPFPRPRGAIAAAMRELNDPRWWLGRDLLRHIVEHADLIDVPVPVTNVEGTVQQGCWLLVPMPLRLVEKLAVFEANLEDL